MRSWWLWIGIVCSGASMPWAGAAAAESALRVGIAELDITPEVSPGADPVWIAGYGQNRQAEGVHDPLYARAVVLIDGKQKVALAAADVVGLQYPFVKQVREQLGDFLFVMVSATHNHEGPDTMGLWGPNPFKSGVNEKYMALLAERIVAAVRQAEEAAVPAVARYGTAQDDTLNRDSRLPQVLDSVLRLISFHRADNDQRLGLLVQWNSHPEAMGSDNKQITADFPGTTVARLKEKYDCPVAYFTGPVGGLMAPPRGLLKNPAGEPYQEGDFEYARVYGEAIAALAVRAVEATEPLELTPLAVAAKPITVPLENPLYLLARSMGVLKRDGRVWTGNFEELGPIVSPKEKGKDPAAETEVAYLRMGQLHVACIPGEIYPELVYGRYQDPVEPNVDYPEAPLEKSVLEILPGPKVLVLGLANDELGYIVPRRQWDHKPPFAYGRAESQYGEENSVGPECAPILMQALEKRVAELASP